MRGALERAAIDVAKPYAPDEFGSLRCTANILPSRRLPQSPAGHPLTAADRFRRSGLFPGHPALFPGSPATVAGRPGISPVRL